MNNPSNDVNPEWIARLFHEAYERLAPDHGYETRKDSAVPWHQVPENNRALMTATVAAVLDALTAAGFVVLRVPEGTAQHGDELELDRERCSLPERCMAWFDPRLGHVAECKPAFLMRVRRPVEVNND